MAKYIEAMATINPQMCKDSNPNIRIELEERNEEPIPHLHVYRDGIRDSKHCIYVRLDKPEYSTHHSSRHHNTFTKGELAQFIAIMKAPWNKFFIEDSKGNFRHPSGYEAAVSTWIDCYGEPVGDLKFTYDNQGNLIMPDYTQLH